MNFYLAKKMMPKQISKSDIGLLYSRSLRTLENLIVMQVDQGDCPGEASQFVPKDGYKRSGIFSRESPTTDGRFKPLEIYICSLWTNQTFDDERKIIVSSRKESVYIKLCLFLKITLNASFFVPRRPRLLIQSSKPGRLSMNWYLNRTMDI